MPAASIADSPTIVDDARIYLASASPRRRELLDQVGISYIQLSPDIDEGAIQGKNPSDRVSAVAHRKAEQGCRMVAENFSKPLPVLAADTAVVCDNVEFGKPHSAAHAIEMLRLLSGRCHWVYTAITIIHGADVYNTTGATKVWFKRMLDDEIQRYGNCGEPLDKAGAYAIQGRAGAFIERIEGSYSNVVGLPLFETVELLGRVGVKP